MGAERGILELDGFLADNELFGRDVLDDHPALLVHLLDLYIVGKHRLHAGHRGLSGLLGQRNLFRCRQGRDFPNLTLVLADDFVLLIGK